MRYIPSILILFLILSCDRDKPIVAPSYELEIPEGFPNPIIPEDNPLNWATLDLGKRLFFDPILSLDSTISCASCHKQEFAFADDLEVSPGVENRLV